MRTAVLSLPVIGALLAGCVVEPEPTACDASGATFALGLTATPPVVDQAQELANAETVRILRPGDVVTLEFNPNRLNIEVDANNRVTAVRCG